MRDMEHYLEEGEDRWGWFELGENILDLYV